MRRQNIAIVKLETTHGVQPSARNGGCSHMAIKKLNTTIFVLYSPGSSTVRPVWQW